MKADYLVCYDITAPGRLARVYRYMRQRGVHLQYSVFHCRLTWPELQRLKQGLAELIRADEDDVRIYPVPAAGPTHVLGRGDRVPGGVDLYLE